MSSVLDEVVDAIEPAPDILSVIAAAKRAYLLSVDVGTSGVRAAFFDDQANEITATRISTPRPYAAFSAPGLLDSDVILTEVIDAIDELMTSMSSDTRIHAIAISCFWHSLIGVDIEGNPTTPLLGWADTRAASAAKDLSTRFDEHELHARTGCRFHPS